MKKLFSVVVLAGLLASETALAQEWDLDYAHSSITFSIKHFFTPVTGKFEQFEGKLNFNPDNPSGSKISFTVQISSVNTDQEKRDKDLVSNSFFDAKTYPSMKFESTKVEKQSDNTYLAHGKMTIKDVTKDVEIPFQILGRGDHPMQKNSELMGLKADFTLDRTDYNVGVGNWAATAVVGDQVTASISLEVLRKK